MSLIEQSVEVKTPLRIAYDQRTQPEGLIEHLGDALAASDRRVAGDPRGFKEMIEARRTATGTWRGPVERPDAS